VILEFAQDLNVFRTVFMLLQSCVKSHALVAVGFEAFLFVCLFVCLFVMTGSEDSASYN
jgi:hypothetical protein